VSQSLKRVAQLFLLIAALIAVATLGKGGAPEVGKPLGEVKAELDDGRVFRLDEHKGAVTVVSFWATWCQPCRQEAKILSRLHQRGVSVVGLAIDGLPMAELKQKARAIGIDYPFGNAEPALLARLGLKVIPTTCVIGRDGLVRFARSGLMSEHELQSAVAEAQR
jgi:cytochrome c biogenesis protein CcmG/thiol:disulfide interchange protein DsbE